MDMVRFIPDVEPERVISILSETIDWGQKFMGVDAYRSSAKTTGAGVKIGILDTGIDPSHPDLQSNLVSSVDFTGDSRPMHGHGTHVAGIAGAKSNGVGIIGVAPDCSLYSVRVLDADGLCPGDYAWIIKGFEWCVENGMDIINLSLGSPSEPPPQLKSIILKAVNSGIIVVSAAGNEGQKQLNWPARYEEVISVAALDKQGRVANFSNTGTGLTIAAPGCDIYSTWTGGGYAKESGTCLPGETVLFSSTGPVKMSKINEGDELISCDPTSLELKKNTVAKKWERGVKQLYRVETSNWTLDGTSNHPVLTVKIEKTNDKKDRKCYSFQWKRIDELQIGDLVFHLHDINFDTECPDTITDPVFAQLLGFMIGDGWLSSPKTGMYMVAFARGKHQHINDEYERLLSMISDNPVHTTKDGKQSYTFGKRLFYLLSHFGVDDGARNKRVPKSIFASSRDVRRAFLIGYLDADGTTPKKTALKGLVFSSASRELMEDIKYLLATVGVQTGNIHSRHRENRIDGRTVSGEEHSATICRSEACRLFDVEFTGRGGIERVGHEMIRNESVRKLIRSSGLRVAKVKGVKPIHSEIVYDIEMVDQTAPCFIANGIVVHNSMASPFVAGLVALMLAYHRNGSDHDTPFTNYRDAIAHLNKFSKPGALLTQSGDPLPIGLLNFDQVVAQSMQENCETMASFSGTPSWRIGLYKMLLSILRKVIL